MKHIARPNDLGDVIFGGQRFDDSLATGKQRKPDHHQNDTEANILGTINLGHKGTKPGELRCAETSRLAVAWF